MFGLLGLVVDIGWANYRKQAAMAAAQSAAYAAAVAAQSSSTYTVQSADCSSRKLDLSAPPRDGRFPLQHTQTDRYLSKA
jgi:hypothetical protein